LVIFANSKVNCSFLFNLIEWKFCFVNMNVVMGQKNIAKTPISWGQTSVVVWPSFPSRGFTHDKMRWRLLFTIGLILGPMEILLIVHVTQGPHHGCRHIFHMYFTGWRNLYGPN
jgi:hypothetical protein